jgi:hypothetical protein
MESALRFSFLALGVNRSPSRNNMAPEPVPNQGFDPDTWGAIVPD